MIRRWLAAWRRRREDLPAALRRALDAERARGGDVVSGPADLGDLRSGRCGLPSVGEAAPDLDERCRDLPAEPLPSRMTSDPTWLRDQRHMTWHERVAEIDRLERILIFPEANR